GVGLDDVGVDGLVIDDALHAAGRHVHEGLENRGVLLDLLDALNLLDSELPGGIDLDAHYLAYQLFLGRDRLVDGRADGQYAGQVGVGEVDLLQTFLGDAHGRHDDVVAVAEQRWDDAVPSSGDGLEGESHLLGEGGAEINV